MHQSDYIWKEYSEEIIFSSPMLKIPCYLATWANLTSFLFHWGVPRITMIQYYVRYFPQLSQQDGAQQYLMPRPVERQIALGLNQMRSNVNIPVTSRLMHISTKRY